MREIEARDALAEFSRRLYDRRLTFYAGGNMSIRTSEGFLITPSGRCKGLLTAEDMVPLNADGSVRGDGRPSVETPVHLAIYGAKGDVDAIVHCHPPHCTALAVRGEGMRTRLTPEGVLLLGDVPMVPYHAPGSEGLADDVVRMMDGPAVLMARHGALTVGRDLEEAYNRMEEMEFQAMLQILSAGAEDLPEAEVRAIRGDKSI